MSTDIVPPDAKETASQGESNQASNTGCLYLTLMLIVAVAVTIGILVLVAPTQR